MGLLCNSMITTVKKYNANQHYTTHRNYKYVALEGEARKEALKKMKLHNQQQRQVFQSVSRQGSNISEAPYRIAYILGKKGKPFSDIELIKDCIIKAVSCLDSDRVYKYKKLPLSRRTITDRQHELALSVSEQLYALCQNEDVCYSIALDEATDINDLVQVLFFIRLITSDFQCYEELLGLGTLTERIRGIDGLNLFKEKFCKINLNLSNLVSVRTDDAPSIIGKHEGFVALLQRELPNPDTLMSFYCILHLQNLCAKSALLSDTLNGVIGIVNYIRANAMRHPQFCQMLYYDDETFSVDLPYHSKVRWLSQGQVLKKVLSLQKQIVNFFEDKNISYQLSEQNFCRNVAFLCDVMSKQNQLNFFLQGETKSIYDMWQKIQAFRKKLTFLKSVLSRPEISAEHFPQLAQIAGRSCNVKEYTLVLDSLIEEYNDRFNTRTAKVSKSTRPLLFSCNRSLCF